MDPTWRLGQIASKAVLNHLMTKVVKVVMSRGGSKPGERRGGRGKGTPNKRTILAAYETAELSIRTQVYKELTRYVASKRNAVEVTG